VRVIIEGVVGSTAYGLATPESDVDRLGVFVHPTRSILGLAPLFETTTETNPDRTIHEVKKFLWLASQCNPTILELLWLDSYTVMTDEGEALLRLRKAVLSQQARDRYAGYAFGQVQRLRSRGDSFSADTRKRTEKHGRHIARLLIQGQHLNATGELRVRLTQSEVDRCVILGMRAAKDPEAFAESIMPLIDDVRDMDSCLPEEPDWRYIDEVLFAIRAAN